MSAKVHFYQDEACTQEFNIIGNVYDHFVGSDYGFDGDKGDRSIFVFYMKNVGDQKALGVVVYPTNDPQRQVAVSDGIQEYSNSYAQFGDMLPDDVRTVYVRIIIASGTAKALRSPTIDAKFASIP